MLPRLPLALFVLLAPLASQAWHDPHNTMTRAAMQSLPGWAGQVWAGQVESHAQFYSCLPDRYRNASKLEQEWMRRFGEAGEGDAVHNVTWRRAEDVAVMRYLLDRIAMELAAGHMHSAAMYSGSMAHLLEDSVSPAHAMEMGLLQEMLPAPAGFGGHLHAAVEITAPRVDLAGCTPKPAGSDSAAAATALLLRCYAAIRDNRQHLIELTGALYKGDQVTVDRLRLRAARAGAKLVADAILTATHLSAVKEPAPAWRVTTSPRGLSLIIGPKASADATGLCTAAYEAFGIGARVRRTELGEVRLTATERDCIAEGSWPPRADAAGVSLVTAISQIRSDITVGQRVASRNAWIRMVDRRGDPLFEIRLAANGAVDIQHHEGRVQKVYSRSKP